MTSMDGERLRAFVVEDEWPARNYLVELLEGSKMAQVVGAVGTSDEALQALGERANIGIDVVFLDVQLGSGERAGLELARAHVEEVRARGEEVMQFVLATASRDHALEAYDLGVVDYLLKPFTEERVTQCLQRVLARRPATKKEEPKAPERIVARRKKNLVFLDANEVWAFEAAHRLTFVHTPHGTFDLDLSLSAIEASFGRKLTRVHRNWLVNTAFVKELEREGSDTRLFVGDAPASALGQPARPGKREGLHVPVARERAQDLKDLLLSNATGLRRG